MKRTANALIAVGVMLILIFAYRYMDHEQTRHRTLAQAETSIAEQRQRMELAKQEETEEVVEEELQADMIAEYRPEPKEAFATLDIPKLNKTLPIVEGVEEDDLAKGVGHIPKTVFPGQGEQIVLSGHRDTVFRGFKDIEIGDRFIVTMPYGTYTYEIQETDIVPEDDTTVIRQMGEEVLVVTTCYPFQYIGDAPYRYIYYAYPV